MATILLALPQVAHCQEEEYEFEDPNQAAIDSLLLATPPDAPNSVKANNYCEIAKITSSVDTTLKYAFLSLDFCDENDIKLIAICNRYIAWGYYMNNQTTIGLPYLQKSTKLLQSIDDMENIGKNYILFSTSYEDLNKPDSIHYYINLALELAIKNKDTSNLSYCYKTLGAIYHNKKMYVEGEQYIRKAIELDSLIRDTLEYAVSYYRLGEFYITVSKDIKSSYTAKELLTKSIRLQDYINSKEDYYITYKYLTYSTLSDVYINLANCTGNNQYADSCLYYINKALDYFMSQGRTNNAVDCGYTYVKYFLFYKKYNEALAFLQRLKKYLSDEPSLFRSNEFYHYLGDIYVRLGDYKNAYECLEKRTEYELALFNDSSMNALAEVKTEQAMMIERLDRENTEKLHAAEKRRMHVIIISLWVGLGLVMVVIGLVIRVLVIKKRANAELSTKNKLLAVQKEEIESQRDTIKAQSDEIQASINYARRIQYSLLTPDETISRIFPDHFLLYKPRNVVSGDYYWVGQFGDNKVCIVADCTGHGVPGGFLSVLGMSNLNYIVGQDVSPDTILNRLREAIIANLRQTNNAPSTLLENGELDPVLYRNCDGMDAAVYIVNEQLMKLSFAGANNPLVLIRGNEMRVLKADKMPVGIYARINPFECTTIDLQKGDCIYTFSDGFQDQFGNGTHEKFSAQRLHDLLLEIHTRPMEEQKEILNSTYEQWRGPVNNQTDDVVIMGVRI